MIHGEGDKVVGVEQSKRMFEKLQEKGKSAELFILPNETHSISLFKNEVQYFERISDFVGGYLDEIAIKSLP